MIDKGIISSEWIYKNIYGFTEEEIVEMDKQKVLDYRTKFRREQIETEGNDPAEKW